jgi:hypothetical protein
MKKNQVAIGIVAALALTAAIGAGSAFAAGTQNFSRGVCTGARCYVASTVDRTVMGTGYVDADGDGVCDNYGTGMMGSGNGNGRCGRP